MPKISVIVPVYKAQKHIGRCVESILGQTFTDFELILVDDASPDGSGSLCDLFAQQDCRIRVIHMEENGGASAARNAGLDAAIGQYISFCDSDDMVSPKWLERLADYADEDTLPICSYCGGISELGGAKKANVPSGIVMDAGEYYRFMQSNIAGYLCNALYNRRIVEENRLRLRIQKEKGDYNEDLLFALQYAQCIKKVVYVGFADYLYDVRCDSLSHSYNAMFFAKYEEKYWLWKTFLEEKNQTEYLQELSTFMLYHFLTALRSEKKYRRFSTIARSRVVQECVECADTSNENPRMIRYIRKRAVVKLWLLFKLSFLKGRLL